MWTLPESQREPDASPYIEQADKSVSRTTSQRKLVVFIREHSLANTVCRPQATVTST